MISVILLTICLLIALTSSGLLIINLMEWNYDGQKRYRQTEKESREVRP